MVRYIHQDPSWPHLQWDEKAFTGLLADVRHHQGRLLGKMSLLGFPLRAEASLATLTADVVTTSAIEGEKLPPEEVRSSLARKLGLDVAGLPRAGRNVEGIVEVMLDATRNYLQPLTKERIFGWHAALFPIGHSGLNKIAVGMWRPPEAGPMQVISGPLGRETIHFEAPAADRLPAEMHRFLTWFNSPDAIDPVLKAAVAHFWFVTIHPLEDGNGRIARAIADMALARADQTSDRFYSMSSQIESERKEYYRQLEFAQRGSIDITNWLEWFLACLGRAIEAADQSLAATLHKAQLWQQLQKFPINDRQRTVINRLLDNFVGFLTSSKYAKLAKCSQDTALRDIRELLQHGILVQNTSGGRSTSYRLATLDELK